MSAKPSPGPWRVNCLQWDEDTEECEVLDARNELIARCPGSSYLLHGSFANASLMAAAPGLLEALEDLVDLCAAGLMGERDDVDSELADARAAIAKARGRE